MLVAPALGDLFADPVGNRDGGSFVFQFNLGDDESLVGVAKNIDFPSRPRGLPGGGPWSPEW